MKHYRCPNCNRTTSAEDNIIPECKCTKTKVSMVEIKKKNGKM